MKVEVQEFMSEQSQALADQAQKFSKNPERFMRKALVNTAEGFKSLKSPVRKMAHSGVKFTAVSQNAVQSLIELQSEVVTSALTAVAKRLERAANAESAADLVLAQIEMLPASRDRIVDEATRAVEIFRHTGRDLRKVATHAYATLTGRTDEELAVAQKTAARKAKRAVRKVEGAVRKTTTRVRKAAA